MPRNTPFVESESPTSSQSKSPSTSVTEVRTSANQTGFTTLLVYTHDRGLITAGVLHRSEPRRPATHIAGLRPRHFCQGSHLRNWSAWTIVNPILLCNLKTLWLLSEFRLDFTNISRQPDLHHTNTACFASASRIPSTRGSCTRTTSLECYSLPEDRQARSARL